MKKVQISGKNKHLSILVDDQDYDLVSSKKWYLSGKYPVCEVWKNGKKKTYRVTYLLLTKVEGKIIDHINGDPLDNTRENLRYCTREQNNRNRSAKNKYGYKGIGKRKNSFVAVLTIKNKVVYGKLRKTAVEAAKDYNELAKKYFGEFARLNTLS